MKTKTAARLLTLIPSLAATLVASAAPDLTPLEKQIESASLRGDTVGANAAIVEIDAALQTDATSPALLYLRGFAEYAVATASLATGDHAAATSHLEAAAHHLTQIKSGPPWEPEAAGLTSAIYGQLITLKGGTAGMTLGPQAGLLMENAERGAPHSPRILFFSGVSLFTRPPEWGGDPAAGLQRLRQAADTFAGQDSVAGGPHWGHAGTLAWLGIALQKTGDVEAARTAWERALALEPEYAWVQQVLLPSLDADAKPTR